MAELEAEEIAESSDDPEEESSTDEDVNVQRWIVENRYSDSILRRYLALHSKFAIETGFMGFSALLFSLFVDYGLLRGDFTIPGLPETWPALTVVFTAVGLKYGWCWTTDTY